ncbi:MAG: ATP synthase subunit I [Legionellales bacterium]|nr:ATP synthase subunit I [Legionellales bacterium]
MPSLFDPKQRIRKIVLIDLTTCLMVICVAGCYAGMIGIKSAGLAGLTYVVPNALRTYCLFRYQGAHAARQILKGFYQGEMLKFGVSLGLFSVVFAGCSVNPIIFFGTYIGMQMLAWLMPVFNKI